MTLDQILTLCSMYNSLGWSVQEQLTNFMNGCDPAELNPNALKMIQEFFETAAKYGNEDAEYEAEWIKDFFAEAVE